MRNTQGGQCPVRFERVERGSLFDQIQKLRYEVYCLDRRFLAAERYPSGRETDDFDDHAVHFAAVAGSGKVVGTARLVLHSGAGLPLYRYFSEPGDLFLRGVPRQRLAEVSRLAVRAPSDAEKSRTHYRRGEIALGLYKQLYQASRQSGVSHLLAAMESPLSRLLARYSFPFQAIGPEIDYFGPVRPYLLEIAKAERVLSQRCPSMLARFSEGLTSQVFFNSYETDGKLLASG